MISFREALGLLLEMAPAAAVERVGLDEAAGRVLRESVTADRPFPPFDRVMMDGFALRLADWAAGIREYEIAGSAPAGQAAATLPEGAGKCLEIMTGAPCPRGADAIVPVEEVAAVVAGRVRFAESGAPEAGRFLHRAGSDATAGVVLLERGRRLGAREIGVAASCGMATLAVSALPDIAVIATGDELVAVDETPAPHQIRQSNAHSLAAALRRAGHPPRWVGALGDDVSVARPALQKLLETHGWLVLTGAVSMGGRDFVPALLADLGCEKIFHGVAQRPGKPLGCWRGPAGQVVLALPGNPVSALTGLHTFLLPALAAAAGLRPEPQRMVAMDTRTLALPDFTRHLPVVFQSDGRADPAPAGNSGDFIGLLRSDGFLTLPPRGGGDAAFPFVPWL